MTKLWHNGQRLQESKAVRAINLSGLSRRARTARRRPGDSLNFVKNWGLALRRFGLHISSGSTLGHSSRGDKFRSAMGQEELTAEERAALVAALERLREEHRDLDAAIDALRGTAQADQLQLQRLKKRKLVLRDRLTRIEDALTPDIIA
jgi:hypothetical protein